MKKIILIVLLAITLFSCDKSESEPELLNPDSELTFNGVTYLLKSASVDASHWKDADGDRTTYHFVFIDKIIPDSEWENPTQNMINQMGETSGVNFSFDKYYNNFDYLNNDTTCTNGDGIHFAWLGIGLQIEKENYREEHVFPNGNFCITRNGVDYIIDFECQTKEGKTMKGYYAGRIYKYDTFDY